MSNTTINASEMTQMFLCGAQNLASNRAWINELNVFPVPDGDTGTNMTMTIVSAVREVSSLGDCTDMKTICKAISSGSLRGARGNSGVILSQLLRGFCKVIRDHQEITVPLAADAFDKAVETAYKAVMKPKEGTILTVAKGAATKARELADAGTDDFGVFIPEVIAYAEVVLASTPDMLPVLKQAGVVDSGGQGLVQVLKGVYEGFQGKEANVDVLLNPEAHADEEEESAEQEETRAKSGQELKFGYCTQFIIYLNKNFNSKSEADFRTYLESIGDHVICSTSDSKVRVQVYTNDPGLIIQRGLLYGQLGNVNVENMRIQDSKDPVFSAEAEKEQSEAANAQAQEQPQEEMPGKDMGIIAVAAGDGLAEIFRTLGVDYVISGGQTMNPSTEDILQAVDHVNADTIFVLPNNSNIILAANQAAAMDHEKKLIVIPTKNVPQGITAVINFIPDQDAEVNRENMTEEIRHVKSCEVTYAVRDTMIDDAEIHEGDMMAIGDHGILSVTDSKNNAAMEALSKMVDDSTELISIYYGCDTTEEDTLALHDEVCAQFPNCEVEMQFGGQPVYYYILSAE